MVRSRGFDPTTPNIARMNGCPPGGKDGLAADRQAAERRSRRH